MKVVRFLSSFPPYNAGDTAGFIESVAARYIALGVAVDADERPAPGGSRDKDKQARAGRSGVVTKETQSEGE